MYFCYPGEESKSGHPKIETRFGAAYSTVSYTLPDGTSFSLLSASGEMLSVVLALLCLIKASSGKIYLSLFWGAYKNLKGLW